MEAMFPVPRIAESFIDSIAQDLGWRRYLDVHTPAAGRLNADYLSSDAIVELKILEEEGLEKAERQNKLAELFARIHGGSAEIDISFENVPTSIRREVESVVSGPIQTVVKKAAKQIGHTLVDLRRESDLGVLLVINNGYSYLNADNFEQLVVRRCANDSRRIDFAFCVTVDYHQGSFDAFVFCTTRCHSIHRGSNWAEEAAVVKALQSKFNDAMTEMMRDQMNPEIWARHLPPITDIRFERDGVKYVRKAPEVPDSRFKGK